MKKLPIIANLIIIILSYQYVMQ